MRRPGRFDRTVCVTPPDVAARAAILELHLRHRPVGEIDALRLARDMEGLSGADIALIVEEAASVAFTAAIATDSDVVIDQEILTRASAAVRPSVGSWLEHAKNHVKFANRDGALDDLADYMRTSGIL